MHTVLGYVLASSSYTRSDQQKYCSLHQVAPESRLPDQLEIGQRLTSSTWSCPGVDVDQEPA